MNMAGTKAGKRTNASTKIDKNREVKTPAEEVKPPTEQEQSLVPTPEQGSEEPNISSITEQPTPEIDASTKSRTYSSGFGWVIIDGKKFNNDVVVLMDGSVVKREKNLSRDKKAKYGHTPLTRKELLPLLKNKPDLIVIGTGQNGAMPITPKAEKILKDNKSFIGPTPDALDCMQKNGRNVVALLHVTC